MGKIKDITGQRFGNLTVLEPTEKRYYRQIVWKCQCDCGNITEVAGGSLRSGHTQSCGCSHTKTKNVIDEAGNRYGKLTVIKRSNKSDSSRSAYWECQCDCGNTRIVSGTDLRSGLIISCHECGAIRGAEKRSQINLGHPGPVKDLANKRFGKLIVLSPTNKRSCGKMVWKCQCDYGNIIEVPSNSLVTGNTQSCGCMRNMSIGEKNLEDLLRANNIPFKKQVTYEDCRDKENGKLRYGFGLLDSNNKIYRLIEFDGEQHFQAIERFGGEQGFQSTQKRDKIKNQYAQRVCTPLVRIPFTKRNCMTIEDILGDKYLV